MKRVQWLSLVLMFAASSAFGQAVHTLDSGKFTCSESSIKMKPMTGDDLANRWWNLFGWSFGQPLRADQPRIKCLEIFNKYWTEGDSAIFTFLDQIESISSEGYSTKDIPTKFSPGQQARIKSKLANLGVKDQPPTAAPTPSPSPAPTAPVAPPPIVKTEEPKPSIVQAPVPKRDPIQHYKWKSSIDISINVDRSTDFQREFLTDQDQRNLHHRLMYGVISDQLEARKIEHSYIEKFGEMYPGFADNKKSMTITEALQRSKSALDEQLKSNPKSYNEQSTAVVDILDKKSMQCSSGTDFILDGVANLTGFQQDNAVAIVIMKPRHVLAGVSKLKNADFVDGVESTVSGRANVRILAPGGQLPDNTRVILAEDYILSRVLDRSLVNKLQVKEQMLERAERELGLKQGRIVDTNGKSPKTDGLNESIFAFGTAEIPSGDLPRKKMDNVPADETLSSMLKPEPPKEVPTATPTLAPQKEVPAATPAPAPPANKGGPNRTFHPKPQASGEPAAKPVPKLRWHKLIEQQKQKGAMVARPEVDHVFERQSVTDPLRHLQIAVDMEAANVSAKTGHQLPPMGRRLISQIQKLPPFVRTYLEDAVANSTGAVVSLNFPNSQLNSLDMQLDSGMQQAMKERQIFRWTQQQAPKGQAVLPIPGANAKCLLNLHVPNSLSYLPKELCESRVSESSPAFNSLVWSSDVSSKQVLRSDTVISFGVLDKRNKLFRIFNFVMAPDSFIFTIYEVQSYENIFL